MYFQVPNTKAVDCFSSCPTNQVSSLRLTPVTRRPLPCSSKSPRCSVTTQESSLMADENPKHQRPWQEIAREAQSYRDASIKDQRIQPPVPAIPRPDKLPKNTFALFDDYLSKDERALTTLLPEQLLAKLAVGEVTATNVSLAFLRRAGIAQSLVCDNFSLDSLSPHTCFLFSLFL